MLCECCRQAPAVYVAEPKRGRYQDDAPLSEALCFDCLRRAKTIEGRITSYRLMSESADPKYWGV